MPRPFLIVPLYMYPLEAAWEPLFRAARSHPDVSFVAIVNPNSGPGPDSLPDANYLAALQEMHGVANICALGYVFCSYGERPEAAARADIARYCRWSRHGNISLAGIFFDETPSQLWRLTYMASLAHYSRLTWRQETGKDGVVIYNPGVVVPRPFFAHADFVVVFEQSHHHWDATLAPRGLARAPVEVRSKTVAVIHSSQAGAAQVGDLTRYVLSLGLTGLFVTDQKDGGYTQWPSLWTELAAAMAAECSQAATQSCARPQDHHQAWSG
ncbi:Spherulation-specific family 4 [Metarhizium album ARSEF 1941]|uniref:Spherulation-specific family 4 n=1 Tax=Metarhizium album (strain ARSEF 1941) TaxID=1081103 RepID=A0A0B2WJH0_METAS|nr:Spherulation-specific family 4 [Metarhizium album ARSEF 1941]KHN93824.1 Spherulation-specific family 4 [Metarhizium album ARSEF 1941]